ncbi:MAG: hypothetical protein ACI9CF_001438 [Candidatus Omnitrophota bacterium]|jgi:hypothetical protein
MKRSLTVGLTLTMALMITAMAFAMGGGNHGANSPVIPISAAVVDALVM